MGAPLARPRGELARSYRCRKCAGDQMNTGIYGFVAWIGTHLCYAVARQHEIGEFAEMKNDPAMKSY